MDLKELVQLAFVSGGIEKSLALTLLLICVLLCLVILLWESRRPMAFKILGCLAISSLALFANNAWVYAVTVFITATLITDLSFLENLAALFMGDRSEFWKTRQLMARLSLASNAEVAEKQNEEIQQEQEAEASAQNRDDSEQSPIGAGIAQTPSDRSAVQVLELDRAMLRNKSAEFQAIALDKLGSKHGLFERSNIYKDPKLPSGRVLDALAFGEDDADELKVFVVEVKYSARSRNFDSWVGQLMLTVADFRSLQAKPKTLKARIRGILIVPSNLQIANRFVPEGQSYYRDIAILRFDLDTQTFTNRLEILSWMSAA